MEDAYSKLNLIQQS